MARQPVVISIDPDNGPDNQLTGVTITGANFTGTPQVFLIGDSAMTDVSGSVRPLLARGAGRVDAGALHCTGL
ncbi:MAG: hypothetical protein R3E79_04265 [Caldilineaceae bacterium]